MKKELLSNLFDKLKKIDGALYKKYKTLQGSYASMEWTLIIQKAQNDTTAPPSHLTISVPHLYSGFPNDIINNKDNIIPLSDFMLRKFESIAKRLSNHQGSGKSGIFYAETMGAEIIEKSSFEFTDKSINFHFRYGLPGTGNRIEASYFEKAIQESFPKIVSEILKWSSYDSNAIKSHINSYKDHEFLRNKLKELKLVAFIPNNAILPRDNADTHLPLENAIPFFSPDSLKVTITLPFHGKITGLGIPEGITLITGGGFHGKTTLLNAIKMGIYNHINGDGREFVVSLKDTFKINSEDGRFAHGINISPYIQNLPYNKSSTNFSSKQCSGSTSQSANTIESLRMKSKCLLFDEDTSATNFLLCDKAMNEIIGEKDKTILPFLESAKNLYNKLKVSTIMVAGSCSQALSIGNHILKVSNYKVEDITESVKIILKQYNDNQIPQRDFNDEAINSRRIIDSENFRILKRKHPFKTKVITKKQIIVDNFKLNFYDNEQIIDIAQTKTMLALMLKFEEHIFNKRKNFETSIFELFEKELSENLMNISNNRSGFASIRPIDFAHMLNRFRILKIK